MPPMNYTKDDFLKLKPKVYLKDGYLDAAKKPRPELRGIWATAAAVQLEQEKPAPMELRVVFEGMKQALPDHKTPPPQQIKGAVHEAFEIAAPILNKPTNPALMNWLVECYEQVKTAEDIKALMIHFEAVIKQYTVFAVQRERGRPGGGASPAIPPKPAPKG